MIGAVGGPFYEHLWINVKTKVKYHNVPSGHIPLPTNQIKPFNLHLKSPRNKFYRQREMGT